MTQRAPLRLAVLSFLLAASAIRVCAFDETSDTWIRGLFTGHSPRAVASEARDAWLAAQDFIARTPGSFLLVGRGSSMQPLYPPGTILVLRDAAYDELRPGQTVVYRNSRHSAVAHLLIAKARDGWRVRGLNNRSHDLEPVVADNLIGVVIAAFAPHQPRQLAHRAGSRVALFLDERAR